MMPGATIFLQEEARQLTIDAWRWALEEAVGTNSGYILAQAILNCYNHTAYKAVGLGRVRALDPSNYRKLIGVIDYRYHGHEPHTVFKNGDELIEKLRKTYRIRRSK